MAFIGNQPAESFTSFATQEFSTSATTSYTLDHAVTNENEIALFINNVRQQPGSGKAYTATGTTLTLSAATASTDTMYCVFLGRALQTVTPATNSITAAMVGNDLISGKTALGATPATTDELLISDAGTLKRIDAQFFQNTPSFLVTISGTQAISNATDTKIQFNSEIYDTDNTFDSSTNYRFTPDVAGKYVLGTGLTLSSMEADEKVQLQIKKNGSRLDYDPIQRSFSTNSGGETISVENNLIAEANTTDYFEVWIYHTEGGSRDIGQYTYFHGYKLIGA